MRYKNALLSMLVFFVAALHTSAQNGGTSPTLEDDFGKKNGNLRFSSLSWNLGVVLNNEIRNDTIELFNAGKDTMNIKIASKPLPYLSATILGSPLAPGKKGAIFLHYDFAAKNDLGFVLDRLQLTTSDADRPQKFITITATIREYFSPTSSTDSLRPIIEIPQTTFDYGTVKQGEKVSHNFVVFNKGSEKLILHKTKTTCGCLKAQLSKNEIGPSDSASVQVEFDSFGKEGADSRSLFLYVNDPQNSEIKLEMKGTVRKN